MKLNEKQLKKYNKKFKSNAYSVIIQDLKDNKVKIIVNCVRISIQDKNKYKDILKD